MTSMKPAVKVLIVVAVVLIAVHLIKRSVYGNDSFIPFLRQEFETVPPSAPFIVTPVPLVVNDKLDDPNPLVATPPPVTLKPILTQVGTQRPAVVPTMVPTFVPSVVPMPPKATALITTRAP